MYCIPPQSLYYSLISSGKYLISVEMTKKIRKDSYDESNNELQKKSQEPHEKDDLRNIKFSSNVIAEKLKQYKVDNEGNEGSKNYWQSYLKGRIVGPDTEEHNKNRRKGCFLCRRETTTLEKTKWGLYPHWYKLHLEGSDYPICKTCYVRIKWQEKHVPKDVTCDRCGKETITVSKYGTPIWVRDKERNGVHYCKGCFAIIRDTGQIRSQQARKNVGIGIHKALDKGIIFGKTKYTLDDTVFDTITEESAYWMGKLMSDGSISRGKTGNPRIALTLAKVDYLHLVKFSKFLKCTNPIKPKKKKYHGAIVIQYYLRFTSKHIAEILIAHGIVPRKSLIAKAIGLENNRHFWRGVFDGDGYLKNKDGKEGDRMVLTGSNDLCAQFEEFIKKNIPGARVTIKKVREFCKLYIYSDTVREVAKLLYSECKVALHRKFVKARRMYPWWQ